MLQVIAAVAWLVWARFGAEGLREALTVGGLLVVGLAVKNLLDTFWRARGKKEAAREAKSAKLSGYWWARRPTRGVLPSPNWSPAPPPRFSGAHSANRVVEEH